MQLFVQEASNTYRTATSAEVFTAAGIAADAKLCKGEVIDNPNMVKELLGAKTQHLAYEVFGVLFLDTQNRVIACDEMFRGTISSVSVIPREIIKTALDYNSVAVIVWHNHPSGSNSPSQPDKHITKKLVDCLSMFDIRMLDHFIIAGSKTFSFAEAGLL